MSRQTDEVRFLAKVDRDGPVSDYAPELGPCWLWTAGRIWSGYGVFSVHGRHVGAHRFAYELLVGPIPDGLQIDHLCRVRSCVNPAHLEAVTNAENQRRKPRQTHCKWGHAMTPENTYVRPSGLYACRICRLATKRRENARKQAARRSAV